MEEKPTTENTNDGDKPETTPLLERADSIAKRLEDSEKRIDEKLKQLQELEAKRILGGRSAAGQPQEQPVESPKEYAKRILSGRV